MDRGEHVILGDALRDQDRVFEVVALPGHERDDHVLTERELAGVDGGTVREDVAGLHPVPRANDGGLVVASVLVRALELLETVDVGELAALAFHAHHDAGRVDRVDDALALGHRAHAAVARHLGLEAGADERSAGLDQRHRLALHVRAHERAVGVVVLEEWDQRGGDGHQLVRRHVHQLDLVRRNEQRVTVVAGVDQVAGQLPSLGIELGVGLGDVVPFFLERAVPAHLGRDRAVDDLAVGRLHEAVLVDAGIGGQGRDQADVRTFRGLDRADAAVVGGVNVAHLEARALAGHAARPQGRKTTLVRDFAERVGLVHELRELRGAEVLLHHRAHGLGVDQVVRHERLELLAHAHALLDRALHAHQTDAVLVLHQLAHRAHAAVAEVIDVVDRTATVLELDQVAHRLEDVALGEDLDIERGLLFLGLVELVVQLEAADLGEIVALRVEEQVVEEGLGRLERGRIAGTQATVDLEDGLLLLLHLVGVQRVAQVAADVEAVDEEHLEALDLGVAQALELVLGHLFVDAQDDLTGILVDDVLRRYLAHHLFGVHGQAVEVRFLELADGLARELAVLAHDGFAVDLDVARGTLAREQIELDRLRVLLAVEEDGLGAVVEREQLLGAVTEGLEQHRRVHLAATIDADVDQILGIELEVEPRTAVRDDAGLVQELTGRVGLALVVVEEHARAAVQLAHHDALGAVDDERTVLGHQRDLAEVDLLLLDVAHDALAALLRDVVDDELDGHLDRRRVGHAALAALVDVVLGALERVPHEHELARAVEIADREHATEHSLEADVLALIERNIRLQEFLVGLLLDIDKIGNLDDLLDFPEALSNPEIGLNGFNRRHCRSSSRGRVAPSAHFWSRTTARAYALT